MQIIQQQKLKMLHITKITEHKRKLIDNKYYLWYK